MSASDKLMQVMWEGALKANQDIVTRKQIQVTDWNALVSALACVMDESMDKFQREWKEVVAARMGEAMVRAVVGAQCYEVAIAGLKKCGLLEG